MGVDVWLLTGCLYQHLTNTPYLTLPYLTGKACYRLALRPPVGPMRIPELTVRLLKPLGVFSKLQE